MSLAKLIGIATDRRGRRRNTEFRTPQRLHQTLSTHHIAALMGEYKRGEVKLRDIADFFGLNPSETRRFEKFLGLISSLSTDQQEIEDVLLLVENGFYTADQAKKRLGLK